MVVSLLTVPWGMLFTLSDKTGYYLDLFVSQICGRGKQKMGFVSSAISCILRCTAAQFGRGVSSCVDDNRFYVVLANVISCIDEFTPLLRSVANSYSNVFSRRCITYTCVPRTAAVRRSRLDMA